MKLFVCAAAPLILLTASCQAPPDYVSPLTDSSASTPRYDAPHPRKMHEPAPESLPQASFFDDFNRDNTSLGLGAGWDMRGREVGVYPIPLPAATDGFIRDGSFTYAGDSVVYASRQLRGPAQRIGALGRWKKTRRGTETTLAMAITPNDKLITDMVHFTANRSVWDLTLRRDNGDFVPVTKGRFTPILQLDREYMFEVEVSDHAVTVRVPGSEVTQEVSTSGLLSDRVFWQEYPNRTPAGVVFEFDSVWAAEAGFPLSVISH